MRFQRVVMSASAEICIPDPFFRLRETGAVSANRSPRKHGAYNRTRPHWYANWSSTAYETWIIMIPEPIKTNFTFSSHPMEPHWLSRYNNLVQSWCHRKSCWSWWNMRRRKWSSSECKFKRELRKKKKKKKNTREIIARNEWWKEKAHSISSLFTQWNRQYNLIPAQPIVQYCYGGLRVPAATELFLGPSPRLACDTGPWRQPKSTPPVSTDPSVPPRRFGGGIWSQSSHRYGICCHLRQCCSQVEFRKFRQSGIHNYTGGRNLSRQSPHRRNVSGYRNTFCLIALVSLDAGGASKVVSQAWIITTMSKVCSGQSSSAEKLSANVSPALSLPVQMLPVAVIINTWLMG